MMMERLKEPGCMPSIINLVGSGTAEGKKNKTETYKERNNHCVN
jgi:hypothetical protein